MNEVQADRKDLKIQALKERLAEVVVTYEDRDAERRIDLTELNNQNQQLINQLSELQMQLSELTPAETVDAEIVEPGEE